MSTTVISVGAACFGIVIGYITYRTLARQKDGAALSDIAGVVAAIGGGTITVWFDRQGSDSFGWYSIGLLIGMATYLILSLIINGREATGKVMSRPDDSTGLPG